MILLIENITKLASDGCDRRECLSHKPFTRWKPHFWLVQDGQKIISDGNIMAIQSGNISADLLRWRYMNSPAS